MQSLDVTHRSIYKYAKNRKEKSKNIYKTRSLHNNRQHTLNTMPTIGENFIMKVNNLIGENKITKEQNENNRTKKKNKKNRIKKQNKKIE